MPSPLRLVRVPLAVVSLVALWGAAVGMAAPARTEPLSDRQPRPHETSNGCESYHPSGHCDERGSSDEHRGKPNDNRDGCATDGDAGRGNDHRCAPDPGPTTSASVGFGKAKITPVGEPPDKWARYFHPDPQTGVWGERYTDLDSDDCYDPGLKVNAPPSISGPREPHVDDPWNSAGDGESRGLFEVDGVTIYGDPQSTGKWDGVWANAGFGSRCTKGIHDHTWARAIVMEVGDETVAMVSLDVVGFFNIEVRRATAELAKRYPRLDIDRLVVSSTHTHEGVDTMGYWGENLGIDGKYPAYQAFIRSQLIDAVAEAYEEREPAFAKFAITEYTMGIRDSRPPQVIDPYLLAAQFLRPDGSTIGTIVNWSNHPEAQASGNPLVSSDFPHGTRETLEQNLGGTAIYFSGSVGGLMTPLGVDIPGYGTEVSWERTYGLGRLVAEKAQEALATATVEGIHDLWSARREIYMDADNTALRGLNAAGVFDIPSYTGAESWGSDSHEHSDGVYSHRAGEQFRTEMIAVRFGPALFLTVPGELFPELEIGGYGRPDCPQADTGRPYEPVIAQQFDAPYQFILGLGQDELGYIVPGYDFWLTHLPKTDDNGDGLIPLGGLEAKDPCGEGHYEETVSASSVMAPWVTCIAAELAGRDPWASEPACSYDNTHLNPYGVGD
ncbi:MAG TPA: hypothetical protein VG929_03550 [Actinomycetota bacterium]|nr:hypothetical protein [Actinomycetota bacterium]